MDNASWRASTSSLSARLGRNPAKQCAWPSLGGLPAFRVQDASPSGKAATEPSEPRDKQYWWGGCASSANGSSGPAGSAGVAGPETCFFNLQPWATHGGLDWGLGSGVMRIVPCW
eukprot:15455563-Alexandrium_andersonii.AAC.1